MNNRIEITVKLIVPLLLVLGTASACSVLGASWEKTTALDGEIVDMYVNTDGCSDQDIQLKVYERDYWTDHYQETVKTTLINNSATGQWKANWTNDGWGEGDPEFVFKVFINGNQLETSNEMKVSSEHICTFTSATWNRSTAQHGDEVGFKVTGDYCKNRTVKVDIYEYDVWGGTWFATKNITFNQHGVATDSWITEWMEDGAEEGNPEYKFKAYAEDLEPIKSGELKVTPMCTISNAYWDKDEVVAGELVQGTIIASSCPNGTSLDIEILESDVDTNTGVDDTNVTIQGGEATFTWESVWMDDGSYQGDPEYFFRTNHPYIPSYNSGEVLVHEFTGSNYQLDLKDGWNFASLPLDPLNTIYLNDLTSKGLVKVMRYNASQDKWKSFMDERASRYNDLNKLEFGKGYWIKMNGSNSINVKGYYQNTSVNLYKGWNMVGWSYKESVNMENALGGKKDNISKISIQNTSQEYNLQHLYPEDFKNYSFEPGKAYWLEAKQEITWKQEPTSDSLNRINPRLPKPGVRKPTHRDLKPGTGKPKNRDKLPRVK